MSMDYGRATGGRAAAVASAILIALFLVVGGRVQIFGSVPGYLAIMTAAVALTAGERTGCAVGFAAGLVADLLGAGPVGLSALLLCVMGYVLGYGRRDGLAGGWQRPLARFAVADVLYTAAYVAVASFMGSVDLGFSGAFAYVVRGAFSDLLVGAIVFILMSRHLARRTTRMSGLYLQ